jgi:hypothetical protein
MSATGSKPAATAFVSRALASRPVAVAGVLAPAALLAAAVAANLAWSRVPLHRAGVILEMRDVLESDPAIAKLHSAISRIPKDAVVSAHYALVPHLSHRRGIYMFPNPFRPSNWGIAGENTHDPQAVEYIVLRNSRGRAPVTDTAESMVVANRFERIAADRDFGLYRRVVAVAISDHASCGDWTGDGDVTAEDLRWIADAIMKGRDCPLRVCDVDGDGAALFADAARLGKRVSDPSVPLQCPP